MACHAVPFDTPVASGQMGIPPARRLLGGTAWHDEGALMSQNPLLVEGERLAKPSLLLSEAESSSGIVGYWRGSGRLGYGPRDDRHRITIDCTWLSQHGIRIRGSLGVYDIDPKWRNPVPFRLDWQPDLSLSQLTMQGGIPLRGHEATSLPPLEAVCLYGGAAVESWLATKRLERGDYDQAAVSEFGREYQSIYQAECPLYNDEIVAVLGGWHAMWPDDDFYIPREMRLVLWTLKDAEPWLEVFERAPNFPIRVRTT